MNNFEKGKIITREHFLRLLIKAFIIIWCLQEKTKAIKSNVVLSKLCYLGDVRINVKVQYSTLLYLRFEFNFAIYREKVTLTWGLVTFPYFQTAAVLVTYEKFKKWKYKIC